jgi:hypothetical protein
MLKEVMLSPLPLCYKSLESLFCLLSLPLRFEERLRTLLSEAACQLA